MKVTIPIMIQDPATAAYKGMVTEENVRVEADFFLDGPVTKKVALIDFDPSTGQIAPPARFVAPDVGRRIGHYDWQDREGFQQVSVFGTVMKTIALGMLRTPAPPPQSRPATPGTPRFCCDRISGRAPR